MGLVEIVKEKCTLCYACVRVCPVKAIEVKVNQDYAKVLPDRCIGCGSCLRICPENAIFYQDSKSHVKQLLDGDQPVVAIVAPSISGEFDDITDYRKFVQMIRQLGFSKVNEVSFGADLIAMKYHELFQNFKGKYYITANCPVVVSNIEKFHPQLIENLAPLVSPMVATAKVVRKKYGKEVQVVYIGPCVEAKQEARLYNDDGKIDAVLTFTELREMFKQYGITEKTLEFSDFDPPYGYLGALYPLSNGILQAVGINEQLMEGLVITSEGRENFIESIRKFESSIDLIKSHFNVFYCDGCLMGPGTSPRGEKFIRRTLVVEYARKRAASLDKATWQDQIDRYRELDFSRHFVEQDQRLPEPSDERINEIVSLIGKADGNIHSGCGACGYDNCREFAVAVSKGLAKSEMCLSYSLRNKHEFIKTLKVTNEKLAQTQDALKASEQLALREKQTAKEASETIKAMLQKLPSGVVMVDESLRILQSNERFINLLGEDAAEINEIIPGLVGADIKTLMPYNFYNLFSYVIQNGENILNRDVKYQDTLLNVSVFTIRKSKIVGAVIRDMHLPEVRKEEVIKRVTEVIDKNLEMVQQIGFLLGEGASDTERMLNSIIESHKSGVKKKSAKE